MNGKYHVYEYKAGQHRCACGKNIIMDDYNKTWSEK